MESTNRPSAGIGERLARFRRIAGLTAQQLSDKTSGTISRGTIARIESGNKVDVTVDELIILAMAIGISPGILAIGLDRPMDSVTLWGDVTARFIDLFEWFESKKFGEEDWRTKDAVQDSFVTAATAISSLIRDGLEIYFGLGSQIRKLEFENPMIDEPNVEVLKEIFELKKSRDRMRVQLLGLGVNLNTDE